MKPEIKVQYDLMTKALTTLNDLEIMEGMFKDIDNDYLNKQKKQLETEYAETMAELAGELAKVAKVKVINMEWISVKDKLPEFDKKVLVFGEQKGMNPQMGGAYISIAKRQDLSKTSVSKNSRSMQDDNQFSFMNYVTHWMPLPEHPKQ